ncbi:hypothetical protein JDV02_008034 [Purpureocillium takamizusanense]|nr:uncharacterized protein JDV02_008034 [Purpureocillium takamizusanense]UNI22114.1 hypothetical protein JDV02_008034 [Purpureocillium takamizusanense]
MPLDSFRLDEEPSRASSTVPTPETRRAPGPTTPSRCLSPCGNISAILHAALPPIEDVRLIIKAGIDVSFHKLITHPLTVLAQEPGGWKGNLAAIPDAKTHPVLLAKYLLIMATCLQFAHPDLHGEEISLLSEPPPQMMRRLADTATDLVTNNDNLVDCVEGLECVMLQSLFEANGGRLRRAWFACRRAMLIAQSMGLHRSRIQQPLKVIDPNQPVYPCYFWYRIVCTDRQLSLMLGLPQGSQDVSMGSEAALASDNILGRFERKQCVIASRILDRNESADAHVVDDFATLREIDADLQKAANEMPDKWWLVPNLASVARDPEKMFWETIRLLEQMLYFNLLNLLHLPYMLRSNTPDTTKYEYSKLTSVNASRELLARFVMFRSFNRVAFCCRSVDFFALIAAMTLVIALLDGHDKQRQRRGGSDISGIGMLPHQRNSDRAMMEQVLDNMQEVARASSDALSKRSSILLKSLLDLEKAAVEGKSHEHNARANGSAATTATADAYTESAVDNGPSIRICIPYFGTVRIGRDRVVAIEAQQRATGPPAMEQSPVLTSTVTASSAERAPEGGYQPEQANEWFGADVLNSGPGSSNAGRLDESLTSPHMRQLTQIPITAGPLLAEQVHQQLFTSSVNDVLQRQDPCPSQIAGMDDWAFHDVDTAFFERLFRGPGGGEVGYDGIWADWGGV